MKELPKVDVADTMGIITRAPGNSAKNSSSNSTNVESVEEEISLLDREAKSESESTRCCGKGGGERRREDAGIPTFAEIDPEFRGEGNGDMSNCVGVEGRRLRAFSSYFAVRGTR